MRDTHDGGLRSAAALDITSRTPKRGATPEALAVAASSAFGMIRSEI
jgi:hypothetical protein